MTEPVLAGNGGITTLFQLLSSLILLPWVMGVDEG